MKKIVVIGVIVLFICVGIQPAFAVNTNIPSDENNAGDNDLIEVTFRICKFNEIIENTVLLTQEESDELESIIDNVKKGLENARDINEEKEVRNNAIISFNNLGLLPDNVNCEGLQKIVLNNIYQKFGNKVKSGSNINYGSEGFNNSFCLITGESDGTIIYSLLALPFLKASGRLYNFYLKYEDIIGPILELMIYIPMAVLSLIGLLFMKYGNTSFFGGAIGFGIYSLLNESGVSASGWIHTNGRNGEKSYEGEWYGQIYILTLAIPYVGAFYDYIGVTGFIGIQIEKENDIYYMGYAKKVHIGTEPIP